MNIITNQTEFKPVGTIEIPEVFFRRIKSGIEKFDSFLSGGWLPGSTFTFTGRAGLGKSTLMLQTLEAIGSQGYKVGIAGCEESVFQMAFTCKRLGVKNVDIANIADVDEIIKHMDTYDVLLVDSFQGLRSTYDMKKRAHEDYCLNTLVNNAKQKECVTGFICHLTKMGQLKGSSDVLHAVDANLAIAGPEADEDPTIRYIYFDKNRFGTAGELTCRMTSTGYDFDSDDIKVDVKDDGAPAKSSSKSSSNNRQHLWNDVKAIDGEITFQKVMPIVNGNVASAMTLLREMVLNGLLTKEGRGNSATYTKV